MTLLVFGRSGQVARELARHIPEGMSARFVSRDEADLADPLACLAVLKQAAPDAVINAAAYTGVDRAEDEEALATRINAETPGVLAMECAAMGVPFVHISTDYVFDGSGDTAWLPHSPTAPLSAYGRSKLAGEEAVRAAGGAHVILRTSWVFSAHGSNFVKTMLRLGAERETLTVVADQIGGPTPAADIARTCLTLVRSLINGGKTGTYHYSGAPDTSWAGFAREIFAQADIKTLVQDIPSSAFPTPAQRPSNSRLDCALLERDHGIPRPDWRAGLRDVLRELS